MVFKSTFKVAAVAATGVVVVQMKLLQVSSIMQLPQDPPQLSSPQALEVQLGEQGSACTGDHKPITVDKTTVKPITANNLNLFIVVIS